MLIFGRIDGTLIDLRKRETRQIAVCCVNADCDHWRESVLFPTSTSAYDTSELSSTSVNLKVTSSNAVRLELISAAQDIP